ncbi:DUF3293 domain-containing protein [Lacibacterium aquatile]|uniref:DUF3293 domain-containing protein n=1 Tax=Lacibacterium aquatile TaxID=1168082 RepID=A0ABW5DSS6_9PROT
MLDPALAAAFAATSYEFRLDRTVYALRLGKPCPPLDAALTRMRADSITCISAHNPGAARVSDAENKAALAGLWAQMEISEWQAFKHVGRPDEDAGWPAEEGVAILDIPLDQAGEVARLWRQLAFVTYRRGDVARLVFSTDLTTLY